MNYQYITIEGNIGAGKTSLANMLSADLNAELILEAFANNPFLPQFYKDPEQYAFPLELFFMAERYQQLLDTSQKELFQNAVITDYLFSKSQLFAENNLNESEFDLYMRLYRFLYTQLPKPEIIIYLHSCIPKLKQNIKERGREYEQEISEDYLVQIEEAYFKHFRSIKNQVIILVVHADQLDFVNREIDYLWVKNLLDQSYSNGIHIV